MCSAYHELDQFVSLSFRKMDVQKVKMKNSYNLVYKLLQFEKFAINHALKYCIRA